MEQKVTVEPFVIGTLGTVPKGLERELKELEISIAKIGQNTDKSPEDQMRLPLSQTPVKAYQRTPV